MMKVKTLEGKRLLKKPIAEKKNPVVPENNSNNKDSTDRDLSPKKHYLFKTSRRSASGENKTKRLQSISEVQEVLDSTGAKGQQTKLYRLKLNSDSLTSLKKVRINKSCEEINKTYPFPRKVSNILNEIKKKKQVSELSLAKRNIVTRESVPLELNVVKGLSSESSKLESDSSGIYGWSRRKHKAKTAGTEKSQSYDCIDKLLKKKLPNKCPSAENEKVKSNFIEAQRNNFYENFSKHDGKKVMVDGNTVKIRKKTKDGQQRQINYALYSFDSPGQEDPNRKFLSEWESSAAKKKNLEICYCPHIHTESYVRKICLQTSTSPTSKFNPQKFKLNYFTTGQKEEEEENEIKPTLNKKLSLSKITLPRDSKTSKYGQKTKIKKTMFDKRNLRNSRTKVTLKMTPGLKKPEKKEKPKKIDINIKDSLDKISLWRNDNKMRILGKQKKGGVESKLRDRKLSLNKKLFDSSPISQKKKDELEILEKLYLKLDSVEKLLKKKKDGNHSSRNDYKISFNETKKIQEPSHPTFFYGTDKEVKKRKLRHAVLDRALQWFDSSTDENL